MDWDGTAGMEREPKLREKGGLAGMEGLRVERPRGAWRSRMERHATMRVM